MTDFPSYESLGPPNDCETPEGRARERVRMVRIYLALWGVARRCGEDAERQGKARLAARARREARDCLGRAARMAGIDLGALMAAVSHGPGAVEAMAERNHGSN